jgi:hypothetical protein
MEPGRRWLKRSQPSKHAYRCHGEPDCRREQAQHHPEWCMGSRPRDMAECSPRGKPGALIQISGTQPLLTAFTNAVTRCDTSRAPMLAVLIS